METREDARRRSLGWTDVDGSPGHTQLREDGTQHLPNVSKLCLHQRIRRVNSWQRTGRLDPKDCVSTGGLHQAGFLPNFEVTGWRESKHYARRCFSGLHGQRRARLLHCGRNLPREAFLLAKAIPGSLRRLLRGKFLLLLVLLLSLDTRTSGFLRLQCNRSSLYKTRCCRCFQYGKVAVSRRC